MKSALIITSEYLGSANEIGSHQIAKQLAAKGIKTLVISFPMSHLYWLRKKKTDYNQRIAFTNKIVEVEDNLSVYIPKTLIPPLPFIISKAPFYLNLWDFFTTNWQKTLPSGTFDFVFCESLFFPKLLQQISYKQLIVRLPDNFSGFWKTNNKLIQAEKQLLAKADIIVTPSKLMKTDLEKSFPPDLIYHLPNGVDFNEYQTAYNKPLIYNNFKFNAVYVGAIASWFDHKLLLETASKNSNWQFVIIGKTTHTHALGNIKYIGEKTGKDKIAYLQHANVGIIPFETKINKSLIDYVNPIKMYEYLAAGIPVISTKWAELELINAPIATVNNSTEFSENLQELESNTKEVTELKGFALNYDWSAITQQLLDKVFHEQN